MVSTERRVQNLRWFLICNSLPIISREEWKMVVARKLSNNEKHYASNKINQPSHDTEFKIMTSKSSFTWSGRQKMWASSCWNLLTRVNPVSVPDSSLRWRTPKSAILRGSSRHERGRWSNITLKITIKITISDHHMFLENIYQMFKATNKRTVQVD